MSVLTSMDEAPECPLCMEPLEMDDRTFFPCTCGYQICRFCWHRIRTDENGLCPACRKAYAENPADFKPLTLEEFQQIKQEKKQKDLQKKQKLTENRKHLTNVRVVQKNLVFVIGLSPRLADPETLKKPEYFGKFGKIQKVVINHSTSYAGSQNNNQGPSATAYVTYQRSEDALRAIQAVNNIHVDGRTLKASLGTTKYCSHFMKNQTCPKPDCMYLHELGDEAASFTKEEMQQGKHQEFERLLQEQYLGSGLLEKPSSENSRQNSTGRSGLHTGVNGTVGSNSKKKNNSNNSSNDRDICGRKSPNDARNSGKEGWPSLNIAHAKENVRKSRGSKNNTIARAVNGEDSGLIKKNVKEKECAKENTIEKEPPVPAEQPSLRINISSCSSSSSVTPTSTPPLPTSSPMSHPPSACTSSMEQEPLFERGSPRVSPALTPPSSLSSLSELSSSLPNSQNMLPLVATSVSNSGDENTEVNCNISPLCCSYLSESFSNLLSKTSANQISVLEDGPSELTSEKPVPLVNGDVEREHHRLNSWMQSTGSEYSANMTGYDVPWQVDYGKVLSDNTVISENHADDDLGFDPFEETNKALAQDIIIEQKQMEQQQQQKNLLLRQRLRNQQLQQKLQPTYQHILPPHLSSANELKNPPHLSSANELKNLIETYSLMQKDLPQARPPPPGFREVNNTGTLSFNSFSVNVPQAVQPKLVPPYVPNGQIPNLCSNRTSPPVNGLLDGSSRLSIPPGLGPNNLTQLNGGLFGGMGMSNHHFQTPHTLLGNVEPSLNLVKNSDMFYKESEHGLNHIRTQFPCMSSVSAMNAMNTLNSLSENHDTSNPTGNVTSYHANSVISFLNLAQQGHRLPIPPPSSNLLHHVNLGALQNTHKGWSAGKMTDLSALDPAIVSSGQLTDSRSDSPPHWLKSLDQQMTSDESFGANSFGNFLHPNLLGGTITGSMSLHNPLQTGLPVLGSRGSTWTATSPPPGFTSLSLHMPKQHEPQKIENI